MNQPEKVLKTILYAEDDPDIRTIVDITVRAMTNYELVACNGGIEAVKKAESSTPDLVLLDVMMPDMDGMAVCNYLCQKEYFKSIPIIFMTAKVQAHEIKKYKKMGVAGIIKKPFNPVDLPELLQNMWLEFQQKQEIQV